MADGLLAYSGLATKIKAMRGRLLSREELLRLTEYESVEEMISFLREYGSYTAVFADREEVAHRGQVEAIIGNSLYKDYGRIYRFAGRGQRQALEQVFMRYEVNELKYCLERVMQRGMGKEDRKPEPFFAAHAAFETAALYGAGSVQELLQALGGTRYAGLLERIWSESGGDYGRCAIQLDIGYYRMAWKRLENISDRRTREICTRILGTEIDWQNIMWMYRFKQFYGSSPADIASELIPVTWRLRKAELAGMLAAEQPQDFMRIVEGTAYFTERDAPVKLGDEISYRAVMEATYRKICGRYPMSIAPVMKYLYDKEREIDMLTTILEGVRYRIPAKEIQELVLITA